MKLRWNPVSNAATLLCLLAAAVVADRTSTSTHLSQSSDSSYNSFYSTPPSIPYYHPNALSPPPAVAPSTSDIRFVYNAGPPTIHGVSFGPSSFPATGAPSFLSQSAIPDSLPSLGGFSDGAASLPGMPPNTELPSVDTAAEAPGPKPSGGANGTAGTGAELALGLGAARATGNPLGAGAGAGSQSGSADKDPLAALDTIGNIGSGEDRIKTPDEVSIASDILDLSSGGGGGGWGVHRIRAADDFGFAALQREQEELHRDNIIILKQKHAIRKAEADLRRYAEKLEQDKQVLAENQAKVQKWTEQMIAHVNSYRDSLIAAQAGVASATGMGGMSDFGATGAAAAPAAPVDPAPADQAAGDQAGVQPRFVSVRTGSVSHPTSASSARNPSSGSSPFLSLFNKVRDGKLRSGAIRPRRRTV